jgi:hypothetical protein
VAQGEGPEFKPQYHKKNIVKENASKNTTEAKAKSRSSLEGKCQEQLHDLEMGQDYFK